MAKMKADPAPLGMADGGVLGSLRGFATNAMERMMPITPPETISQKYARQDAERAARATPVAAGSAPTPAPAEAPVQLGGVNLGVMARREAAAGLRDGGRVHGPGTGTSDSVPARYSNGEYVLPTDTAQAIGYDNLDAIKDATHTPVVEQHGLRGGAHFDNGGFRVLPEAPTPGIERPFTPADAEAFGTRGPATAAVERPFTPADTRAFGSAAPKGAPAPSMLDANVGQATAKAGGKVVGGLRAMAGSVLNGAGRLAAPAMLAGQAVQTANTPTDDYGQRTGIETGSVAGDLGARAVGTLQDIGNNLTFGVADRVGNAIAGNGFGRSDSFAGPGASATAARATATPSAQGPSASPAGVQTDLQRGGGNVGANPADTNVDLGTGIRRINGGSSPLFTNVQGADNDRLMGRGPTSAQNQGAIDGIQARQDMADNARANAAQVAKEEADAAATNAQTAQGLRGRRLTKAGTELALRRDEINAAREHNRAIEGLTGRGQDLSYGSSMYGHQTTRDSAVARLQYEKAMKDRDVAIGRSDHADAQDEVQFKRREQAQKDMTDRIGSMLPQVPGADGKLGTDTVTAARHVTALNAQVGARMDVLNKHLQLNPGDKQAASELEGLKRNGIAHIGEDNIRKFVVGNQAADVASATHTPWYVPWGSTAVNSAAPIGKLTRKETLFGHDYISDRGDVIPGRHIDRAGATAGFGGKVNKDFDPLKGVRQ